MARLFADQDVLYQYHHQVNYLIIHYKHPHEYWLDDDRANPVYFNLLQPMHHKHIVEIIAKHETAL